ncbi:hypothetical protein A6769_29760 [Nostoc punctiforme NIES-2108]|uniref:ABC transporter domain-containing protein n=1 Tax=Nostoc punctiforme NIES-2108 TaxID=1356359 RepID=A0A367R718_NOSPU|nr:hypothetical protein A6769_29760 [Nostoc punctiforme NIES-2108]
MFRSVSDSVLTCGQNPLWLEKIAIALERKLNYYISDRLTQKCTTFVVSHNLRAVKQADLILYIEDGQILAQGTHQELLHLSGRYSAIYALKSAVNSQEDRHVETRFIASLKTNYLHQ